MTSNNLEYWDTIDGIGELYIENELVVGVETLLFVCTDKKNSQRWLFMTYDSYEGVYVFAKIETECLLRLLKNEITMEAAFREAEYINETYIAEYGTMNFCQETAVSFDERKLPDKGAYYNISSQYICDYINELEKESVKIYVEYEYIKNSNIHFEGSRILIDYYVQTEGDCQFVVECMDSAYYGKKIQQQIEEYVGYESLMEDDQSLELESMAA